MRHLQLWIKPKMTMMTNWMACLVMMMKMISLISTRMIVKKRMTFWVVLIPVAFQKGRRGLNWRWPWWTRGLMNWFKCWMYVLLIFNKTQSHLMASKLVWRLFNKWASFPRENDKTSVFISKRYASLLVSKSLVSPLRHQRSNSVTFVLIQAIYSANLLSKSLVQ